MTEDAIDRVTLIILLLTAYPSVHPLPGKSWNVLGSDADSSFWLQIDMFMQTKTAVIVATGYIFCAAGMLKMLSWPGWTPLGGSYSALPDSLAAVFTIFRHSWLTTGSWKMLLGSWKVLEFFVSKRVGTVIFVYIFSTAAMLIIVRTP